MPTPSLRQRFRGALLGTAVGDALGAPFEGRSRIDAHRLCALLKGPDPLRWTDDTAMTIALAESLIASDGFDGADMAHRFIAAHDTEPWRGYGAGPPRIFAAIRAGAPWHRPAHELFDGGSYGNGAAMRVAPVGLYTHRDRSQTVELAAATAVITHAHDLAVQGAAVQAFAVAWLTTTDASEQPWDARHLLDELRRVAAASEYQRAFDVLSHFEHERRLGSQVPTEVVVREIGNGVAAVQAVPAALHAVLRHPRSFTDAVAYAIALGGDTDTIAAMTGAMAGALLAEPAIPAAWTARVEAHDHLRAIADQLLNATTRMGEPSEDS